MSWIRSWDLNILRWSNLSRCERFARIGQFHHFDHFGAQVLLLWCLKKSRAWQRLMNSYYIFCKSIFAQNYLKLDSTQAQIRDLVRRKEDKMRAWVICCVLARSGFTYTGRLGRWHGTRDRWLAAKQGRSNFAALVLMTRNIKMPDEW